MSKKFLSIISLLLSFVMLLGTFASCTQSNNVSDDTTESNTKTESTESGSSENDTNETETGDKTADEDEPILITGDNAELITLANGLVNGVNPHYTDSSRNELTISNLEMDLGYNMTHADGDMLVSHLSTKDGHAYIQDTMDIFLTTTDGHTYYAGKSSNVTSAVLNIYRYGYYYYETRIEGQSFINEIAAENLKSLVIKADQKHCHDIDNIKKIDNGLSYTIAGSDPYLILNGISFSASQYDYLEVTIKTEAKAGTSELYITAGSASNFNSTQCEPFSLYADGEPHTYRLPLSAFADYTGTVRGIRFDINGLVGSTVEISDLKIFKANYGSAPTDLTLQRSFLTYSDKLHHLFQISAYNEVNNIQKIGMITKIPVDTVDKLIVKVHSKTGDYYYDSLDAGIAWNYAQYVGFDIKDAGIFGYILPYDGSGGNLRVEIVDGYYVIEQYIVPEDFKISPSCVYNPEKKAQEGRYQTIVANNGNDFFMGQRIYTDEYHTFDEFIKEAECEVNPLTEENVTIDLLGSDNGGFAGYDALRGYYKFTVAGTGFNQPYYKYPNKHYTVKFTVTGDQYDRQMYFMSYTTSGQLECAVLLDEQELLLPVPLEVAKNFAGDGENTIYNNEDRAYGEAFFPMILKANETKGYSIVNLYQNWGNVPLKQLSSIQFHTPYYHLSTGVTETNCIVPFNVVGPGLPDFRGMSAPVWKGQPQHTSGGAHSFLCYTDANGEYRTSDTTGVKIDSYGPTYAEISLDYVSSDGKMVATYTHMEMPQTDENRSYYEMQYTVLEDIKIDDFKNNFRFYYCTDNNSAGSYKKLGYLDQNNEYQVVDVAASADYVLGDECPYFTLFMMPDWLRDNPHAEGYTNIAFLIYNYEIIIGGEKIDTNFYLRNRGGAASLSLNLDDVVLKAGDTFTINAILMPWGSQELEDDPANRYNQAHTTGYTDYTYSTVLEDGTLYMDKNVRDVRENTLLNPIKATADKDCEVIESVYVPKLKTTNGKTAEFTISGGHNNNAVRIYGFEKLTAPKVEEFVDGEWVTFDLNSANHPDTYGYAHYYDGYRVNYDGDGTYSYSFVITMDNGAPRKFRIAADEDFEGWPEIENKDDTIEDPINYFLQPSELLLLTASTSSIAGALLNQDRSAISLSGYAKSSETFMYFFQNNGAEKITTGQYVVLKYRLPTGMSKPNSFELFAGTEGTAATGTGDRVEFKTQIDDQWHVIIIDLSKLDKVSADDNGDYLINFVRWDILNGKVSDDMYIDIAYFGLHDDLSEIYAMELNKEIIPSETPQYVELIEGNKTTKIDPNTGEAYVPTYIDPENEQGYTLSDVEYAGWIDYVNRVSNSFGTHNDKQLPVYSNPTKQTIGEGLLVLTGWMLVEGGIDKYVWSADGGKTWHDTVMYNGYTLQGAGADTISSYGFIKQYTDADGNVIKPELADTTTAQINGGFRGSSGICANLADFYEIGSTVNVTFAAVPSADPTSLCLIGHITNVEVYIAPKLEPNATVNLPLSPEAIYNKVAASSKNYTFASATLSEDKSIVRFDAKANAGDQYGLMMNGNTQHTGQYLYLKYRIPVGSGYSTLSAMEIFTSTVNAHFQGGDSFNINVIQDGEWHVVIVDVSQKLAATKFGKNSEGRYVAKYLRVDVFEQKSGSGMYAEFAAMGFADNLDVIYKEICGDMDYVTVIGSSTTKVDPTTGAAFVKTYIKEESGYTKSSVEYAGWIDMINGMGGNKGTANKTSIRVNHTIATPEFSDHCGTTLADTQLLTLAGWFVANGGVEKYVWSADGGKTWHDASLYLRTGFDPAGAAHLEQLAAVGAVISDENATKANCIFQGSAGKGAQTGGIAADLADYAGKKVDVTFAAVPKNDPNGLCLIIQIVGVQVPVIEAE